MNVLPHAGYVNFCKDFKLPVKGLQVTEVFKKSSINNNPHEYDQFNNSLTKLGVTINNAKAAEKKKKIFEIQKELKNRNQPKETPKRNKELDAD